MTAGSKTTRVLVAVVFAAAVAVIAASVVVIKQSNRIAKIEDRIGSGSVEQVAFEADREARNLHFSLASDDRKHRVDGVMTPDGEGFLVGGTLQEASSGQVYQLWADNASTIVSLGFLGDDATEATAFRLPSSGPVSRLFITAESGIGAVTPGTPVVSGAIPGFE
jgi:hypothetical protein